MRGILTDLLLSVAAVLEQEGRSLRRGIMLLVAGTCLLAATLAFMVSGIGLIALALYYGLASVAGPAWGALLSGCFVLLAAGICALVAKLLVR